MPDGGATQYPSLGPGQTIKFTTGVAHSIESLRVKVWCDVGDVVKESNEDNNEVERLLKP
jgi:subtilase family serine protease